MEDIHVVEECREMFRKEIYVLGQEILKFREMCEKEVILSFLNSNSIAKDTRETVKPIDRKSKRQQTNRQIIVHKSRHKIENYID